MRYFRMATEESISSSVQITGWENKVNRQWICMEELYRLPKRMVLSVKTGEFTPLPDVITSPFLLATEMVYKVIGMYGDEVYTRDVILMNTEEHLQRHYYLLVLSYAKNGKIPLEERNIFYMDVNGKKEIIVSLDFAESILRRGAIGIQLQELEVS